MQLGQGSRQRRIQAAETDRTGAIAEEIAQDKELTRMLLSAVGVPVPEGRPVADAEDAWATAEEIGVPVVVKPRDGNQGRGVATNLTTRSRSPPPITPRCRRATANRSSWNGLPSATTIACWSSAGRVVAAARREPAQVVGDGVHSVTELIEAVNADPRRGDHHATVLSKIKLDPTALAVLAEQGYGPDSVPAAAAIVLIRRNGNLSTGGTAIDVTERVHPQVAARAVEAAAVIGLNVAGVDVVAMDISRPLDEQGGVVVEVNAAPGCGCTCNPRWAFPAR